MTLRLPFHFSLSCIGEGNGNPLQCSCLENPRDREVCWAAVYGVTQSRTRLKRLSSSTSKHDRTTELNWYISSVQFSHSVLSDSLRPHELQHTRPPCPSPTPRVYSNSCPLSQWCHPTISSSVDPFSSRPQSFPASGSFQMSQLFTSGGQSTGVSASTSVLPMNIQDWFILGWTGWISLQSKGLQESSPTPQFKSVNSSVLSFLYSPTLPSIHDHWKTIALTRWTFVGKVLSLIFNMLSRLLIILMISDTIILISSMLRFKLHCFFFYSPLSHLVPFCFLPWQWCCSRNY